MTVYSNTKGKMTECRGQNKYTRRKKMKKRMAAVVLSLILVMQMVFTTGIMQKSVKAIDRENGI